MNTASQLFERGQRATARAFERVSRVGTVEPNDDVRLYNSLTPEMFPELMKTYGEDKVVGYIKAMETQRLMGGK